MKVEQFVMAYRVEQDRLRAILPEGFTSLRPVLRLNAEIRRGAAGYLEFNTAVEKDGVRGWLNIGYWEDIPFAREGKTVTFPSGFLSLSFTGLGKEGGCPAEKDNAGCYFLRSCAALRPAEQITSPKEYCDCRFQWRGENGAGGESMGASVPAYPEEVAHIYEKQVFSVENAAAIPCRQVLGAYRVAFERT